MTVSVCVSVCLCACVRVFVREHIAGTARPIFARFFVQVTYVPSVL